MRECIEKERDFEAICEMLEMMFPMQNFNLKELLYDVEKKLKNTYRNIEFEYKIIGQNLYINITKLNYETINLNILLEIGRFRYTEGNFKEFKEEMKEYIYRGIRFYIERYWFSKLYKEDKQ